MKVYTVLVILFCSFALGSIVNNVRLVDHANYMIEVITETVLAIEKKGWCNLKLPYFSQHVNETVVNRPVIGEVNFINGFAVSIQHMDIEQRTVQQVWNSQTPIVTIRGSLRMYNVAVGYDVVSNLEDGKHQHTVIFVHPLISFMFTIIKNITDDVITSVTVVTNIERTTLSGDFKPLDKTSDVLGVMFEATLTTAGVNAWGPEILEPIAHDLIMKEIKFPTVCYNCAITG